MNVIKSLLCLSTVLVVVLLGLGYCEEYKIVKRPGKNPLKCYKRASTTECVEMEPDEIENEGGRLEDNHDLETGPLGGKLYKIGDEQMECFPNGQCFDLNGELISDDDDMTPVTVKPKKKASPTRIVKRPGKNPLKCFKEGGVSKCIEMKPEEVDADGGPLEDNHDLETGPLGGKLYKVGDEMMECFPNGQCFDLNGELISDDDDITPTTVKPKRKLPPTRIVKRPGKNPLKCFKEGGVSKCIEMKPEEVEAGGAPLDDPHDVEKGPLGGKIYRFGDSVMECFPNGQCFEVNQNEITSEPTKRPDSRFYRRDHEIVECFSTGKCNVVDPVTFDEEKHCWVVDANASVDNENIEAYEDFVNKDEGEAIENDFEYGDSGNSDGNGDSGYNGENDDYWGNMGYWDYVDVDDEDYDHVCGYSTDFQADIHSAGQFAGLGKATCTFKKSEAREAEVEGEEDEEEKEVEGTIILVEESANGPIQMKGNLKGLKEGVHVMTFHQNGDVETKGCHGVGGYHRPNENTRSRRQIFARNKKKKKPEPERNSYKNCLLHVEACKEKRVSSYKCGTNLNRCVQLLKCKKCKEKAAHLELPNVSFDTIGDLEEGGHLTFKAGIPRKSLYIYTDCSGITEFEETEREQSLSGPDSVLGRSIVLSRLPKKPDGDFISVACCKIEGGRPKIFM